MGRKTLRLAFLFIFIMGCQVGELETTSKESVPETYDFKTDDGMVNIVLINNAGHDQEYINTFESAVKNGYQKIKDGIAELDTYSEVVITFTDKPGDQTYVTGMTIRIDRDHDIDDFGEYLILELVSALVKNYYYKDGGDFFTTGLAYYLYENDEGNLYWEDFTWHQTMLGYLKSSEVEYYPLTDLFGTNVFAEINFDGDLFPMEIVEAVSFTSFLIENYGYENFLKIYNQEEVHLLIQEVYKKTLKQLEQEWLDYIEQQQLPYIEDIS